MTTDVTPALPSELPVLALRQTVVFPLTLQPLAVSRAGSMESVHRALASDRLLFLTLQESDREDPEPGDLKPLGTVAAIRQMAKVPGNGLHIIVEGIARARATAFVKSGAGLQATITPALEHAEHSLEVDAYVRRLRDLMDRAMSVMSGLSQELRGAIMSIDDPLRLAYLLSSLLDMKADEKQRILETDDLPTKLQTVSSALNREISLLELKGKIESEAQQEMTDAQRQYYLRQQLKAIQQELGEGSDKSDSAELRDRVKSVALPEAIATATTRELDRLDRMTPASPEYQMIRTYIEWVLDIPWTTTTEDRLDPKAARAVLDEDHYDLDKVKSRIVEYLAVQKLKAARLQSATPGGNGATGPTAVPQGVPVVTPAPAAMVMKGPILCFVGPPGVGKTSLGQSIARAMNRKFVRISLGGVRDEAEIRGHRRTYIGAIPGRIIQAMKQAGAMNPVFMLDEIDKVTTGYQGDPAAALLEVLDPAQNHSFRDHYLEVPVDLSRVLFIATANQLGTIQPALLDRMEVIQLSGYSEDEKLHIARRFLIPRQLDEHGLPADAVDITDQAIRRVIAEYTREAGVRNLERQLGTITRKIAAGVASASADDATPMVLPHRVDEAEVPTHLGAAHFHQEVAFRVSRPGVATGVAWTESGGDVLFIEASLLPAGHGNLTLTGQLGSVMQESARAAVSHIRSRSTELGVAADTFETFDLHVHVPAGAIPKDGPSAGVTMATAIVSAARRQTVREDVAMTGEITLSGLVLPVGGIREKALAARRHGIKTFILPALNAADVAELSEEVRQAMHFVPVRTLDEALAIALPPAASAS